MEVKQFRLNASLPLQGLLAPYGSMENLSLVTKVGSAGPSPKGPPTPVPFGESAAQKVLPLKINCGVG